ncbi:MAG: hypothetical protein AAB284_00095, partial [Chloroflexota bacterium]
MSAHPAPQIAPWRAPSPARTTMLLGGLAAAAIGWSAVGTGFSLVTPLEPNNLAAIGRFVQALFPPDLSPDFLARTVRLAVETVQISVLGTVV